MTRYGLMYCRRCGRFVQGDRTSTEEHCDCCGAKVYPVPEEYWGNEYGITISDENKQRVIEELVKPSPEFNKYHFLRRDKVLNEHTMQYVDQMMQEERMAQNSGPRCPSCGSTRISKIGIVSRAVSTELFGLASSKIGKTHKCNNCGTTW